MKKFYITIALLLTVVLSNAQLSVNADVVSRYIFRGVDYGNSPAFQPSIAYTAGNFVVGGWGSYAFAEQTINQESVSFREADLYAAYSFDFGLSVGVTDLYFPGTKWFEFGDMTSSHAFELNLNQQIKNFSISANTMLNNSLGGASEKGIWYFELGYAKDNIEFFIGGGDGIFVTSYEKGDFQVVNLGIKGTKELKITETFSLPVFGQVILNPNTEDLHLVVGFTL